MRTAKSFTALFVAFVVLFTSAFSCASAMVQLQRYVPIGIAAFDGAVNIISPVPGSPLQLDKALVDGTWAAVNSAIAAYQNAPADQKQTKLQQVVQALNAVEAGISKTLMDFGVGGNVDQAVQAALVLITATLESIEAQLQPNAPAKASQPKTMRVKDTDFVIDGNPSHFVKQYNAIMVSGGHPDHQLK